MVMNFEADDLDWALGELLHLTWQAKRCGMLVHKFNPEFFAACMRCINAQPFAIRERAFKAFLNLDPHKVFVGYENARAH
jgi:hypothetical protein